MQLVQIYSKTGTAYNQAKTHTLCACFWPRKRQKQEILSRSLLIVCWYQVHCFTYDYDSNSHYLRGSGCRLRFTGATRRVPETNRYPPNSGGRTRTHLRVTRLFRGPDEPGPPGTGSRYPDNKWFRLRSSSGPDKWMIERTSIAFR